MLDNTRLIQRLAPDEHMDQRDPRIFTATRAKYLGPVHFLFVHHAHERFLSAHLSLSTAWLRSVGELLRAGGGAQEQGHSPTHRLMGGAPLPNGEPPWSAPLRWPLGKTPPPCHCSPR